MSEGRLINAVRWRLRASRRLWGRDAKPEMPLLEAKVVADGRLDSPGSGTDVNRGEIFTISGWAVFPQGPGVKVEIWLDDRLLGLARLGLPRPDLGTQIDNPVANLSGFELTTDPTEWPEPNGNHRIRAVAHAPDGEALELGVAFSLAPEEEEELDEAKAELESLPTLERPREGSPHVLFFTHQLTLGGAQLYLLDLIRELVTEHGIAATVASTLDGPLRKDLTELGVPTHLTSIEAAHGPRAHLGRIEELTAWAREKSFDAVFVNTATATTIPGVELATSLGIPSIWAIHESLVPRSLWHGLHPEVREIAEKALEDASTVLFVAEGTQRLFEPAAPGGRMVSIPYGLDFSPIEEARASIDPAAERREAGIPADAEVVVCIGTVEPRKAQVALTQAFELIADRHPRAYLALVGGRKDLDAELLGSYIAASPYSDRMELVKLTPEVQRWHGMADIHVCASDVESLPRSVLEAMVWEVPVLATDIFGLPEIVEEGKTGWLCPPRDVEQLAAALDRALSSSTEERRRIGSAARELILERHSLPEYGRRVNELLTEVTSEAASSRQPD